MPTQRGFALLVLLLATTVGAAGLIVSARNPVAREQSTRGAEGSAALARADDALRAYALADGYRNPGSSPSPTNVRPGSLPCPDGDSPPDYAVDLFAGDDCPAYLGRLPHRTLDVARIRDHAREPLWYALDPGFRDHEDAEPINLATPAGLTIDGTGEFAAVVLAPGPPLAGQSRDPSAGASAYLEGGNADGDGDFVDCGNVPGCNDRARGITVAELLELVPFRLLHDVRRALASFFDDEGYYPWAAELGDPDGACDGPPSATRYGTLPVEQGTCGSFVVRESAGGPLADWIIDNQWYRYVYYAVAKPCDPTGACTAGAPNLLSLDGTGGQAVIFATTGVPIVSHAKGAQQDRGGPVPQDVIEHLDSNENTDGDDFFDDPDDDTGENDRVRAIAAP